MCQDACMTAYTLHCRLLGRLTISSLASRSRSWPRSWSRSRSRSRSRSWSRSWSWSQKVYFSIINLRKAKSQRHVPLAEHPDGWHESMIEDQVTVTPARKLQNFLTIYIYIYHIYTYTCINTCLHILPRAKIISPRTGTERIIVERIGRIAPGKAERHVCVSRLKKIGLCFLSSVDFC